MPGAEHDGSHLASALTPLAHAHPPPLAALSATVPLPYRLLHRLPIRPDGAALATHGKRFEGGAIAALTLGKRIRGHPRKAAHVAPAERARLKFRFVLFDHLHPPASLSVPIRSPLLGFWPHTPCVLVAPSTGSGTACSSQSYPPTCPGATRPAPGP